jgi:fatty acid synthase subunit alpha
MLMQNSEGADRRIAPLRRVLAVWGLMADDIGVLSIHGTSTQPNEKNETYMWNTILKTLDHTAGNAVPIMAQKSLVDHSKGGTAAWQMVGLLQSITRHSSCNRNADNVDALFQQHSLLMFLSKTIQTDGITAGVMVCSLIFILNRLCN